MGVKMKQCMNCGQTYENDVKFCVKCGAPIKQEVKVPPINEKKAEPAKHNTKPALKKKKDSKKFWIIGIFISFCIIAAAALALTAVLLTKPDKEGVMFIKEGNLQYITNDGEEITMVAYKYQENMFGTGYSSGNLDESQIQGWMDMTTFTDGTYAYYLKEINRYNDDQGFKASLMRKEIHKDNKEAEKISEINWSGVEGYPNRPLKDLTSQINAMPYLMKIEDTVTWIYFIKENTLYRYGTDDQSEKIATGIKGLFYANDSSILFYMQDGTMGTYNFQTKDCQVMDHSNINSIYSTFEDYSALYFMSQDESSNEMYFNKDGITQTIVLEKEIMGCNLLKLFEDGTLYYTVPSAQTLDLNQYISDKNKKKDEKAKEPDLEDYAVEQVDQERYLELEEYYKSLKEQYNTDYYYDYYDIHEFMEDHDWYGYYNNTGDYGSLEEYLKAICTNSEYDYEAYDKAYDEYDRIRIRNEYRSQLKNYSQDLTYTLYDLYFYNGKESVLVSSNVKDSWISQIGYAGDRTELKSLVYSISNVQPEIICDISDLGSTYIENVVTMIKDNIQESNTFLCAIDGKAIEVNTDLKSQMDVWISENGKTGYLSSPYDENNLRDWYSIDLTQDKPEAVLLDKNVEGIPQIYDNKIYYIKNRTEDAYGDLYSNGEVIQSGIKLDENIIIGKLDNEMLLSLISGGGDESIGAYNMFVMKPDGETAKSLDSIAQVIPVNEAYYVLQTDGKLYGEGVLTYLKDGEEMPLMKDVFNIISPADDNFQDIRNLYFSY